MPYWLEYAYLLTGGPVLAGLAALGLWQLWIAKRNLDASARAIEVAQQDIQQRVESERLRLSVDLSLRFASEVLPLVDEALCVLKSAPLPSAKANSDPWLLQSYDAKWSPGLFAETRIKSVTRALNAMEAIAVPFVAGAADLEAVRDSFGFGFCVSADQFGFVVAVLRDKHGESAYPAVRSLVALLNLPRSSYPALPHRRAPREVDSAWNQA
jgi:hypothetical protein